MLMIAFPRRPVPQHAVVFDCDGLLVNTQHAWNRAYVELFRRYGASITAAQRYELIGLQLIPLGHRLAELLGHPAEPRALGDELYELVQNNLGEGIAPMPGAVDLVSALAGTRPLAIASNTPSSIVRGYLAPFFDLDAFAAIIGSDTTAAPKPAPDAYLNACAAIGIDPEDALALEDSPTGATAAITAGLYLVAAPTTPDLTFPCHMRIPNLKDRWLWNSLGIVSPAKATK